MVSGGVIIPTQEPQPDNHNNHETHNDAHGEIRNSHPNKPAVANPRFRLRRQRDWFC